MSFKNLIFKSKKSESKAKIEVEPGLDIFIPDEFRQNPVKYFENKGKNIKLGGVKRDETRKVREDPTAVKELPVWRDASGKELRIIGKRVNIEKGKVKESSDPFYEYEIMKTVVSVGLPAPRPVAKVEQGGTYFNYYGESARNRLV